MKLIIQRVNKAKVTVVDPSKDETIKPIGEIGKGLFVLVGVKKGDTKTQAEFLAQKLLKLRVMSDTNDKMNLSVIDTKGELLIVSQFTLYADTTGGNRPSFINAALPEEAKEIYEHFVDQSKLGGVKVETGQFGSYMKIETECDGPVTIVLEN